MKNRSGRDRILLPTGTAFLQRAGPSGPVHRPAFRSLTLGADKSVRPSLLIESNETISHEFPMPRYARQPARMKMGLFCPFTVA